MKKHIIVIGITLVLLTVGLSGCNEISETVNPPNFVITSKQNREGYEGPDRVGYVDITVKMMEAVEKKRSMLK